MMKKMRLMMMLGRCKSVSTKLGRAYSYTSLRSQSARKDPQDHLHDHDIDQSSSTQSSVHQTVLVGHTKKPYVISKQHLKHPLLNALVEKQQRYESDDDEDGSCVITVKCEVVLFDHLLWMLENGDQSHILESLDDFAHLYLSP